MTAEMKNLDASAVTSGSHFISILWKK